MTKKERVKLIIDRLNIKYKNAECALVHTYPHELLIATRLSAQCTDARVNIVTKPLFEKYRSVIDFAKADLTDVEDIIKTCGLYKTKAKDIINMCKMMLDKYDGIVPDNMEDLTSLPGIGRKTANLILGDIYNQPAIVVDTHCIRVTNRLSLVKLKDPYKIEMALKKIVPPDESSDFCHRIVFFGRDICKARNPLCNDCMMNDICKFVDNVK